MIFTTYVLQMGPCKVAISLRCSKEKMIERLLKRSETSGRIDDKVSIFEKRYEGYLDESVPVIEHLRTANVKLIEVSSLCDVFILAKVTNSEQIPSGDDGEAGGWHMFRRALMVR